jgi:ketosteroid isomerase-like protein
MEYVMSDSQKPAELFRRSLDAFLAQDMRAWADLCAEDVLVTAFSILESIRLDLGYRMDVHP